MFSSSFYSFHRNSDKIIVNLFLCGKNISTYFLWNVEWKKFICRLPFKMNRTSSIVKKIKIYSSKASHTMQFSYNRYCKFLFENFHLCGITQTSYNEVEDEEIILSITCLVILIQSVPTNWIEHFMVGIRWWFRYFHWWGKVEWIVFN